MDTPILEPATTISPPPSPTQTNQPTGRTKNKRKRKETGVQWLDDAHNPTRGESSLWIAVITQAMMDALSQSRGSEAMYHKNEATIWLTENRKDFIDVCLLAGLCPDYVRRKAKKAIASPKNWRAAPGEGKRYHERRRRLEKGRTKPAPDKGDELPQAIILKGPWG